MKSTHALLLALPFLVCAPGAHAGTASSTFSNLRFQVLDLDPSDGVAPAFEVTRAGATAEVYEDGGGYDTSDSSDTRLVAGSRRDDGNVATVANTSGVVDGTSMAVTATGLPWNPAQTFSRARTQVDGAFTLGPGAEVLFSGDLDSHGTADGHQVWAWMQLAGQQGDVGSLSTVTFDQDGPQHLSTYLINTGTTPITGLFHASTSVGANAVAAVPEPGGAGLALAGLGLLGLASWRRRKPGGAVRAAVATALLACAWTAQAGTLSSSATISNLRWQLVDLDPTDGIAPAFSIDAISSRARAGWFEQDGSSEVGLAVESAVDDGDFARVANTSGTLAGSALTATATAGGPGDFRYSSAAIDGQFTLAPGTQLILSSDLQASIHGPAHQSWNDIEAYLQLRSAADGPPIENRVYVDYSDVPGDYARHFATAFINAGPTAIQGFFSVDVNVYQEAMDSPVSTPVPEPGGALLLLSGLGLLGATAARGRGRR